MTTATAAAARRAALVDLFNSIDTNHDGQLSPKEIVRAFSLSSDLQKKLSQVPSLNGLTASRLRICIKEMEGDKNEAIELSEWIDYIEDVVDTALLVSVFDSVETNADNTTNMKNVEQIIHEFNKQSNIQEQHSTSKLLTTIQSKIQSVNESGLISRDDWMDVAFEYLNDIEQVEVVDDVVDEKDNNIVTNISVQPIKSITTTVPPLLPLIPPQQQPDISLLKVECDMMHDLTLAPIQNASEMYCDVCGDILGEDGEEHFVCRTCEWSICTKCVKSKYAQELDDQVNKAVKNAAINVADEPENYEDEDEANGDVINDDVVHDDVVNDDVVSSSVVDDDVLNNEVLDNEVLDNEVLDSEVLNDIVNAEDNKIVNTIAPPQQQQNQQQPDISLLKVECDMMHDLTLAPIQNASEMYCDVCGDILGEDGEEHFVCRTCEWSICTECVKSKYAQEIDDQVNKVINKKEEAEEEEEQPMQQTESETDANVKETTTLPPSPIPLSIQQTKPETEEKENKVDEATTPPFPNLEELGMNLPTPLVNAAKHKTTALAALDVMASNFDIETVNVYQQLLNDTGSTTEREIVLDGIIRRIEPSILKKYANEAAQMRIMVDLAIQQSSSEGSILDSSNLKDLAQTLQNKSSVVVPSPSASTLPSPSSASLSPQSSLLTIDSDIQSLQSSPVSSSKRRKLNLIFLMVEPLTQYDGKRYGIGPSNHALAEHLTATLSNYHYINGLKILQQYILNDQNINRKDFLNTLLSTSNKSNNNQTNNVDTSADYATSSIINEISTMISEIEIGTRSSPIHKNRMGYKVGSHVHNFMISNYLQNGLKNINLLMSRLDVLFSKITWRIIYIRTPNPNLVTRRELSRKNRSITKSKLIEIENDIKNEKMDYLTRTSSLIKYVEKQKPRVFYNRNIKDLQINKTMYNGGKKRRNINETQKIQMPWLFNINLDHAEQLPDQKHQENGEHQENIDLYSLADSIYKWITGSSSTTSSLPISSTWLVNKTGVLSESSQTNPQQTMPPSLDVSNIKKKTWKNKKHQIFRGPKKNKKEILQKKKLKRGQWNNNNRGRGGSEMLRKRLELQLLQSQNVSRIQQPDVPFPLPLSPFAKHRQNNTNIEPSPLQRRVKQPPPPPQPPSLTLEMELWAWLKRLKLSMWPRMSDPTKWRRNLQNGYIIGEILERYYRPVGVRNGRHKTTNNSSKYNFKLHALDPCATHERKKIDNWRIIEKFITTKKCNLSYVEKEVLLGNIIRTKRETALPQKTVGLKDYSNFNKQQIEKKTSSGEQFLTQEDIIDGTMHGAPGHGISMLESLYFWLNSHENKISTLNNLYWKPKNQMIQQEQEEEILFDTMNYKCYHFIMNNLQNSLSRLVEYIRRSTHGTNRLDLRGFQGGGEMNANELNTIMKSQFHLQFKTIAWNHAGHDVDTSHTFGSEIDILIYFFDQNYDGQLSYDEIYQKLVRWEERIDHLTEKQYDQIVRDYMYTNVKYWKPTSRDDNSIGNGIDSVNEIRINDNNDPSDTNEQYQAPQQQQFYHQQQYEDVEDEKDVSQLCGSNHQLEEQSLPLTSSWTSSLSSSPTPHSQWIVPEPPLENDEFDILLNSSKDRDGYQPSWFDENSDEEPEPEWVTKERRNDNEPNDDFLQTAASNFDKWPSY